MDGSLSTNGPEAEMTKMAPPIISSSLSSQSTLTHFHFLFFVTLVSLFYSKMLSDMTGFKQQWYCHGATSFKMA
jgi:hypothetical protein